MVRMHAMRFVEVRSQSCVLQHRAEQMDESSRPTGAEQLSVGMKLAGSWHDSQF